jgi:hypothetical protein
MEYAGSGTNYNALPENGGVPQESNESINLNSGKVWLTSTDQNGKFKVGDTFAVDQQTGFVTIDPNSYSTNLVSDLSPELGGDLDVLTRNIYSSVGNVRINDTLEVNSGSAATPAITFNGDTNTGIYSPGADQVAVSTGGTERLRIDSTGKTTITKTGDNVAGSAALDITTTGYAANDGSSPHYGIKVSQSGPRYHLNYGVYSEVADTIGFHGYQIVDGMYLRGCGVYGFSPNSQTAYQESIGVYGKSSNPNWNYNRIYGVKGYALPGTAVFDNASSVLQAGYGGHFLSTGKGNCIGVYADAYLDASPGAGTEAVPLLVASSSTERFRVTSGGTATLTSAASTAPFIAKIGSSEVSRIDSSGRLLVGTSTASTATSAQYSRIQIVGHTGATEAPGRLVLRRNETSSNISINEQIGQIYFGDNEAGEYALIECASENTAGSSDYPGRLVFSTTADGAASPTERMRITNAGEVLIGTTTPVLNAAGLSTSATAAFASGLRLQDGGSVGWSGNPTIRNNNGSGYLICMNGTTGGVGLLNGGTSWTSLSDESYKTNLKPITEASAKIRSLRSVTGRYIDDDESISRSFLIAQDVEAVLPEAVSTAENGKKLLSYTDTIPLLTAALKEALEKIETLEAKVAALEAS